jgi:hypothetical protein
LRVIGAEPKKLSKTIEAELNIYSLRWTKLLKI